MKILHRFQVRGKIEFYHAGLEDHSGDYDLGDDTKVIYINDVQLAPLLYHLDGEKVIVTIQTEE